MRVDLAGKTETQETLETYIFLAVSAKPIDDERNRQGRQNKQPVELTFGSHNLDDGVPYFLNDPVRVEQSFSFQPALPFRVNTLRNIPFRLRLLTMPPDRWIQGRDIFLSFLESQLGSLSRQQPSGH